LRCLAILQDKLKVIRGILTTKGTRARSKDRAKSARLYALESLAHSMPSLKRDI